MYQLSIYVDKSEEWGTSRLRARGTVGEERVMMMRLSDALPLERRLAISGIVLAGTWWATVLGLLGTAASLSLVIGGYWDGWWHFNIGRDTFWTRPHLFMYAEVITALLVGTLGVADRALRPSAVVIGMGGLLSILAAPIDNLWHAIFGVDFTVWSPPHLAGIVYGGAVSLIGLLPWWMTQQRLLPPRTRVMARVALAVQVAALLPWLLFVLMEYEQTLTMRVSVLAYRWDLQAAYYPVFIAYLSFACAVAVARAVGSMELAAGSIGAYLLLLSLSSALGGFAPMARPVPLFLSLVVLAAVLRLIPGAGGEVSACLVSVPLLYLGLSLAARPVPYSLGAVLGTGSAALAGAIGGRILSRALAELAHAGA